MCGISACILLGNASELPGADQCLHKSLEHIKHRGPDHQHTWKSQDGRVAFGHARLSIRDLSTRGHQPLVSAAQDIVVVVNGEIYDQANLRRELSADYDFQSTSDSELLIPLYLKYGTSLFAKLRGEFAFCLYDTRRQLFIAARDRYGIKPLHWTIQNNRLLIASEAKAFKAWGWEPEWDVKSIVEDGWIHDERTLFKGVRKLRPGHYLTCSSFEYVERRQYWDLDYPNKVNSRPTGPQGDLLLTNKHIDDNRTEDEMIEGVRQRLLDAVSARLESDVPIGLYLSGGIDSAVIAGMLKAIKGKRNPKAEQINGSTPNGTSGHKSYEKPSLENVTCFTVGFDETTEFDEAAIAKRTADWLGLPLVKTLVDERRIAEAFEDATYHSEHHNADCQYIGKFLLSKAAHEHGYRVILSGEGSDEHLGGYACLLPDYLREPDFSSPHRQKLAPEERQAQLQRAEAHAGNYKGTEDEKPTSKASNPAFEDFAVARRMINDASIAAKLWKVTLATFASWTTNAFGSDLSIERTRADTADGRVLSLMNDQWHPLHTAQYIWTRSILPNVILTCMGDRMEMSHSVEGRPPFLDHKLTEYLNGLPPSVKIKQITDGQFYKEEGAATEKRPQFVEKWILREAARPFITDEMYYRKKHPFTAPVLYSKGQPLHRLMQRLVTEENVENLGFLDWSRIESLMDQAFPESPESAKDSSQAGVNGRMYATRVIVTTAQFVVLSQKFGVRRATP